MKIICDDPSRPRIDKYLSSLEVEALYSRTLIERLIGEKKVTVNGKPVKKSHPLEAGDTIEIELPEPVATEIEPENIPLNILFEDEYLIAIDKTGRTHRASCARQPQRDACQRAGSPLR